MRCTNAASVSSPGGGRDRFARAWIPGLKRKEPPRRLCVDGCVRVSPQLVRSSRSMLNIASAIRCGFPVTCFDFQKFERCRSRRAMLRGTVEPIQESFCHIIIMTLTQRKELDCHLEAPAMSNNDCSTMESYCLERARLEPPNRGRWIAQAERWHELGRAHDSWRQQKRTLQQSMQTGPMATQRQQG